MILTIMVFLLIVIVIYKSTYQQRSQSRLYREPFYASFDEKYIDPKIHPYSHDIGFRPDAQNQPNTNIGDGTKLYTHLTDIETTNQKLKTNQNAAKNKRVRFANPPVSDVKYITEPFNANMSNTDTLLVDEDIDKQFSNDIAVMNDNQISSMTMTDDECVNTFNNMRNMVIMIKDVGKCDLNILNDDKYNDCINNLEYENMSNLSQSYLSRTYDSIYTLNDTINNMQDKQDK